MPFAVFAALLGATGVMRLIELLVSRARMRTRREYVVAEPRLFPLMALLHTGLVVNPVVEVLLLDRPFNVPIAVGAALVLILATALRIWTLKTIGKAWNVRVVAPISIATTGPYRWIRHPNYLVVILEIAALPLIHGAWLSALSLSILNAFVLFIRIRTEETTLAKNDAWLRAMKDKKRLIPGIF